MIEVLSRLVRALPTRNPMDFRSSTTPLPHPLLPPSGNAAYIMVETFDSFYAGSYVYAASSTESSQIRQRFSTIPKRYGG